MSKLYTEILSKNQLDIFAKLNNFSEMGTLAGGTSLAFQLGHRLSRDFDIFSLKPIHKSPLNTTRKI